MSNSERESLAKEHGMTVEFVDWFFDTKKESCGNVWFMMMAVMWEGWKEQEARCTALAAENVGLKDAAEFSTADDMWVEQADGMLDYRYVEWYVDVLKAAMETPATDAFLAEVRASAIEHAASERWGSGYVFDELNEFAAQLRKGVQS
ncbi:hypothetical protein ACIQCX_13490 [Enterobacter cancerogenus]|uniref:hypothetical protein n=1 Tax=Enterobacter cancerogenus TaxID=69218 RepID=UPI0037FE5E25